MSAISVLIVGLLLWPIAAFAQQGPPISNMTCAADPATLTGWICTKGVPAGTPDGLHSFSVTVKDAAGNTATGTALIVVDGKPPTVVVGPGPSGGVRVLANDTGSGVTEITLSMDGAVLP